MLGDPDPAFRRRLPYRTVCAIGSTRRYLFFWRQSCRRPWCRELLGSHAAHRLKDTQVAMLRGRGAGAPDPIAAAGRSRTPTVGMSGRHSRSPLLPRRRNKFQIGERNVTPPGWRPVSARRSFESAPAVARPRRARKTVLPVEASGVSSGNWSASWIFLFSSAWFPQTRCEVSLRSHGRFRKDKSATCKVMQGLPLCHPPIGVDGGFLAGARSRAIRPDLGSRAIGAMSAASSA